jgi:hypothetical protein
MMRFAAALASAWDTVKESRSEVEGARWRLGEVAINGMRGRSGQHDYADVQSKAARGRQLLRGASDLGLRRRQR